MYVYTCAPDWESMLSCIYTAWASGHGQQNIRLELEPIEDRTFFDTYEHVDADYGKAKSVMDAIYSKLSPYVYNELAYSAQAYEKDVLDNIYRVLILGFAFGPGVLNMLQYAAVSRNREIRVRVGREACRIKENVRFHEIRKSLYVAHIEPKSRILLSMADYFQDRMPSENWMIVDDVHAEAIIHPKNEDYYIRSLTDSELDTLLETEKENDKFTDLWLTFFNSIAIKERENLKLQKNHMPLWTRKHVVEFQNMFTDKITED